MIQLLALLVVSSCLAAQNLLPTDMRQWRLLVGDARYVEIGAQQTYVWWRPKGVANQQHSWGGCAAKFVTKRAGDYLLATKARCCSTGWETFKVSVHALDAAGKRSKLVWSSTFNDRVVDQEIVQWRVPLAVGAFEFEIQCPTRDFKIDVAFCRGAVLSLARRPMVTFDADEDVGVHLNYELHRYWPRSALLLFVSKKRLSRPVSIFGVDGGLWLADPIWVGTHTTQLRKSYGWRHRVWFDLATSGVFWQVLEVDLSKPGVRLGSRNYTHRDIRSGM